jgi:hypothetical protein
MARKKWEQLLLSLFKGINNIDTMGIAEMQSKILITIDHLREHYKKELPTLGSVWKEEVPVFVEKPESYIISLKPLSVLN